MNYQFYQATQSALDGASNFYSQLVNLPANLIAGVSNTANNIPNMIPFAAGQGPHQAPYGQPDQNMSPQANQPLPQQQSLQGGGMGFYGSSQNNGGFQGSKWQFNPQSKTGYTGDQNSDKGSNPFSNIMGSLKGMIPGGGGGSGGGGGMGGGGSSSGVDQSQVDASIANGPTAYAPGTTSDSMNFTGMDAIGGF